MVLMVNEVVEGCVDVCILVGNIGVLMIVGFFIVGCIKGIECLVFVLMFLILDGKGFLMLDVGVNVDVKFEYLF